MNARAQITCVLLPIPILCCTALFAEDTTRPRPVSPTPSVEVTFLVNEGFLLRSGEANVLIDAFVAVPNSMYGALPTAVYEDMLVGNPPFSSIQLALVSHVHRDHFQALAAGMFLKNHPETLLASSPEVLQSVRDNFPESGSIEVLFEDR
jgi:glyoxylase-like metal-dependent hydrolase (beta-lactamase superfamily II)